MMPANIKAVVFKTTQLKATRIFFEDTLKLQIKESSARHFVIYSKGIRLVFVESLTDFEVEMYLCDQWNHPDKKLQPEVNPADLKSFKDPNGIGIIIARQKIK